MVDRDRTHPTTARRGPLGPLTPPDKLPTDGPAIVFAIVCFAVALGLTRAEVEVVVGGGPAPVRAVVFLLLVALSITVLMLGSASLERGLQGLPGGRKNSAARVLYWLTTSIVALSAVVILGAALMLILGSVVNPTAPDTSGNRSGLRDRHRARSDRGRARHGIDPPRVAEDSTA